MHGRSKTATAPVSDAVTREQRCCPRVGAASIFFFFSFPDSADLPWIGAIRANSGRIGLYRVKPPIQAEIKKKKKMQNAPFFTSIQSISVLKMHLRNILHFNL